MRRYTKIRLKVFEIDLMIFDLLAPPQGPRGRGHKKCAVACPINVSNSHTKFGWNSFNGLGGDSVRDGRTELRLQYPHRLLKKRGDNNYLTLYVCVCGGGESYLVRKNKKYNNFIQGVRFDLLVLPGFFSTFPDFLKILHENNIFLSQSGVRAPRPHLERPLNPPVLLTNSTTTFIYISMNRSLNP